MSIELEIGANTNDPLTLDEDDIESINPVKTHTGVGDFSARIAGNRDVEEYAQRQDRVNIKSDGTTFFTGYLLKVSHNKQRGTTRLQGRGIGKRLQETRPDYDALGGSLTYTNIALEDAIDNYWSRTPFNASVTPQSTSTVSSDDQVALIDSNQEFIDNFSFSNTDPLYTDNGKLKLAQSAFLAEAEDFNFVQTVSDVSYSDGEAAQDLNNVGDVLLQFDFTTEYDWEAGDWGTALRVAAAGSAGVNNVYGVFVDNQQVGNNRNPTSDLSWQTETANFDLDAGTHTLEVEIQAIEDDQMILDIGGAYDTRFNYTFDNTVDSDNGHLDGPELYPTTTTTETSDFTTTLNITEADLTTTFNDTTEDQRIGLSFDKGSSFDRASNTNTLTANNSSASRTIRAELRLSGYPFGSNPQNATPRFGYNGQTVDSAEILVDTNNLVVIDELELSKNHFDNLQTLHEYGDFIWVIEHDNADISNLTVNSFQRGGETRSIPALTDNDINKTPKVDSSQYYNSIFVQGALVSGSRPTAEAKDQTAISNDRDEISPGVLRDLDVVTEGGADFRAQSLLDKAQKNSALRGQKVTPAVDLSPGYSYPVDFGEGLKQFTAEEVSITKGTDRAETTLDFIPRSDISEDIRELRRNARKTEDQV